MASLALTFFRPNITLCKFSLLRIWKPPETPEEKAAKEEERKRKKKSKKEKEKADSVKSEKSDEEEAEPPKHLACMHVIFGVHLLFMTIYVVFLVPKLLAGPRNPRKRSVSDGLIISPIGSIV